MTLPATLPFPTRRNSSPAVRSERFTLKADGGYVFLPYEDVAWIEAQGDYVKFHAGEKSCLVRMTMKSLEDNLDPARFLRVHRSAAVNLDQVEKIRLSAVQRGYEVVMRDGRRISISGGYRSEVKAMFQSALGPADSRSGLPSTIRNTQRAAVADDSI